MCHGPLLGRLNLSKIGSQKTPPQRTLLLMMAFYFFMTYNHLLLNRLEVAFNTNINQSGSLKLIKQNDYSVLL